MTIAVTLVLTALAAFAIVRPLLSAEESAVLGHGEAEAAQLSDQRGRFLQMLRDLDFDHATGKVAGEEYQRMRGALVSDLAAILRRLKELEH